MNIWYMIFEWGHKVDVGIHFLESLLNLGPVFMDTSIQMTQKNVHNLCICYLSSIRGLLFRE